MSNPQIYLTEVKLNLLKLISIHWSVTYIQVFTLTLGLKETG